MKSLKLLTCLFTLALGLTSCGSDEEETSVTPPEKEAEKETPQPEEQLTTADELLETSFMQWISSSDATLCWEITDKAYQELKDGKIQATFGIAWSTAEDALVPVGNRLNAHTESVDFSQGLQTLTKLARLTPFTTYYYAPFVDMDDTLHVAPVRYFTTMDNIPSSGRAPAGAQAVDMGLPSGTKWASMNIGAEKPADTGLFFAWGETEGYVADGSDGHLFSWATYKWCSGSRDSQTKYCTVYGYGVIDNEIVLSFADDAAYVNWGEEWRMPTAEEMKELIENSTSKWTTLNGVDGYQFTSNVTGNSIFLPAAGCRVSESHYEDGTDCYYWSSSIDKQSPYASRYLRFYVGRVFVASLFRYYGMNIRPVQRQ